MKNIKNTIWLVVLFIFIGCGKDSGNSGTLGGSTFGKEGSGGKAGSLSRFTIVGDYLYVAGRNNVETFSIIDPANIKSVHKLRLNSNLETIFYNNNRLFLGADNGMTILSIVDQAKPKYISRYVHVLGCDPVVVRGDYAYVTIRNGVSCRRNSTVNLLEVVDLRNISFPRRVQAYQMTFPKGLDVDNDGVYVCDKEGLKIFDNNGGTKLTLANTLIDIIGDDVIVLNKHLMSIGSTGLVQYDISDLDKIEKLSTIKLEK